MQSRAAFAVFDSLTEKQHETLALAVQHMTSKQIALQLGVAPVTVDKRIEAVRGRLDSISRPDLLRWYGEWCHLYGRAINDPIILAGQGQLADDSVSQPQGIAFLFEDSIAFDARASWDRGAKRLHTGLKPSDLGVSGKMLVMLGGAVAIMMVAVLSIAFADALMTMLER